MRKKRTKAALVLEMLNKGMSAREIRERMKVSPSYIHTLRKRMIHVDASDEAVKEVAYQATRGRQAREADTNVDAILTERGDRYGSFLGHAHVTIALKQVLHNKIAQRDLHLFPDQIEALDMICHKLGRIVNGDPHYADSWIDIAGYAKLVADRLEGKIR